MIITGKGLVIGLWTTLRHLFRPAITVQYPARKIEPKPRFRARHALLMKEDGTHRCIACLACVRICPDRLITVKSHKEEIPDSEKKRIVIDGFTVEMEACMFCGLCEDVCPTTAIVLTRRYEMACEDRRALFLDVRELIESGKGYDPPG
ncbi:MAG: NADH-quinone oxidoreductase subunit I [bacterium]